MNARFTPTGEGKGEHEVRPCVTYVIRSTFELHGEHDDLPASVFSVRLAEASRPDTMLMLGAGETVIGQTEHFTPSERFRGFYLAAIPSLLTSRAAAG